MNNKKLWGDGENLEAVGLSFKNKVPYRIFLLEPSPKDQQDVHLLSMKGNMIGEHIQPQKTILVFTTFKALRKGEASKI